MITPVASLIRQAMLLVVALLVATGCARTRQETVLASDTLKVVAVTRSTLDITTSDYRHHTTYDIYLHGEKLSDAGFSRLLQAPETEGERFVHSDAIALDTQAVLLASHVGEGARCWTTRLSVHAGKAVLEKIVESSVDCSPRPAPRGWRVLYDEADNLLLVRERPFQVYPIARYWQVLLIEGDVVALYNDERDSGQRVVRLVRISTDSPLAELRLPMQQYAEPGLLHASPGERRRWLFENFTVAMAAPFSIALRPDNRLHTITPEVWAAYQQIDRENRDADARARAAGEAWHAAQRRALMEADATRPTKQVSP